MSATPPFDPFPLGLHWPTIDPFLFCAHHNDAYPRGNGKFGPDASLAGRDLGMDFAGIDGWNMYHGSAVPGFPQHPHRGFETVTYVRQGVIDHADSLGAAARFGAGDTQWLTAGAGIVHSEMFPLLNTDRPNPAELFQIWLNLPAADKMVDAHFSMLWSEDLPRHRFANDANAANEANGPVVEVVTIAGALNGRVPPSPPPRSWAARADADVAIWHLRFDAGASWTLPAAAGPETHRTLYCFVGDGLDVDGKELAANHGVVIDGSRALRMHAPGGAIECVMLQGRPIGEPVAKYGPFVLNDRAGIERAFDDYQRTQFGGWPWPTDDPSHGADAARFARHASGVTETRGSAHG